MELSIELQEVSSRVEEALRRYFSENDRDIAVLKEAEQYALLGGGKRIRPFLVLKTCSLLGGDESLAMPFALAMEMIHTYSLVHDDLPCMDNDDLRRGQPTCHKRYGESTALLAGDALLTNAFSCIASAEGLSCEARIRAVGILAKSAGDMGMLKGQALDAFAETHQIQMEALLTMNALKTGALIDASMQLGAIAAGLSENDERLKALSSYSQLLGLAFQVIDDILDVTGNEATLGKSIGSDKKRGKTTFLSFMTVSQAEQYAVTLTESAVSAIEPLDRNGLFSALAYYLCNRKG